MARGRAAQGFAIMPGSMSRSRTPIFDLREPDARAGLDATLAKLRATASLTGPEAQSVAQTVEDVRTRGDAAIVDYMRRWTDPRFDAARIAVPPEALADAERQLTGELREAIEQSIANVRKYQQHVMPPEVSAVRIGGAELGMRFTPVDSVGLCVPGGSAVLFSTLIMLAVPAIVAGVAPGSISVINSPPLRRGDEDVGDISPIVLGVCAMLGITKLYRIGGAAGVAALAHGTDTVRPVDLIAGPGNVYTQLAKMQVAGVCGTDNGFYGPSEIVTLADDTAHPVRLAADLIAQAEHNPGKCFLLAWDRGVVDRVLNEVEAQLAQRGRSDAIDRALAEESCAVVAPDRDAAIALVNTFAAEHVNLAVKDAVALLPRIRHAGEIFLGDATPVAAGDYYAGPSHCLPTGTTARFTSGVSVYTFLKRTGTVAYPDGMPAEAIRHVAALAEAEGLDGHAHSVRVRG